LTLAFYVSGHGFGHASRQVEIINTVARRLPDTKFLIRSTAASWLLHRTLRVPFTLDARPVGVGVVQIDGLQLDAEATAHAARRFYDDFDALADAEAARLAAGHVSLVVSDAPPLACAAAARARIPCVVVANFTWDWIYRGFGRAFDAAPDVIPTIEGAYREASAAWRLPMHGGFATFETIRDVPLVARHASLARDDTRRALGLPIARPLALASFGGFGVQGIELRSLDCLDEWDVVLTAPSRPAVTPDGVHFIGDAEVYDRGVRYEDLVHACDAVLTKPGYGIVSECIANDTAIVYTPRGEFAEYPVLVAHIERWLRHSFIARSDLLAGRWHRALRAAVSCAAPSERPATNGADVIADIITPLCSADDPSSGHPQLPSS
jgi:L-arabinokinase